MRSRLCLGAGGPASAALLGILGLLLAGGACQSRQKESPEAGLRLLRNGQYSQAIDLARLQQKAGAEGELSARWRLVEAEALLESGQVGAAAQLLEKSNESSAVEFRVRGRILLARLALGQAGIAKAANLLAEAKSEAQAAQRQDWDLEASLMEAQVAGRQGKWAEAEAAFLAGKTRAASSKDPYREAVAVNGLGMLRLVRSQFDEAIPYFEEAQKLWRQAAAQHWVAVAAHNLGLCYSQLGDFERAQQLREEALQVAQPSLLRANALGESGTMYLLQQQPEKAIPLYREARDMAQQFGMLTDAARWASNLTAALAMTRNWDAAEQALQSALALKPEARSRVFLELNRAAIAHGRGRQPEARRLYEEILKENPEQVTVRWQAEAGLANTWLAEKRSSEARKHFEAALQIIEAGRSELNRNEHKLTFLARLIRVYQDYVDLLVEEGDPENALVIAESSRARLLAERSANAMSRTKRGKTWGDGGGAVRLAYWLAPKRSFLWIIAGSKPRLVQLPGEAEVAALVEAYRGFLEGALRDPMQSPNEAGRKLYELLLAPAAPELAKYKQAIVVPDGALHQLSFETLPNYGVQPPRYWNEEVTAAVAPALSSGLSIARGLPTKPAALVMGNPQAVSPDYPALPQAGREIDTVARLFAGPRLVVLRGAEAKPEVWKSSRPQDFALIHIAAHAEANRQNPLESAIILSRGSAFRLFARDILAQPLRAELVTLSACRSSGARSYAGEGQVGLAWAFLGAGARAAIAGLWDVPDQSTAQLMEKFYEGLRQGAAPAAALREARIALIRAGFRKPYYWGPFQCYLR